MLQSQIASPEVIVIVRAGFPKLVSPKAKAGKTLFGTIKPTNHKSEWLTKARAVLE